MRFLLETYYVGQKFKVINSTPVYNGKIVTIYSLRFNSPSKLITVKLPDGSLQQFMPYQLEEIDNKREQSMRFLREDHEVFDYKGYDLDINLDSDYENEIFVVNVNISKDGKRLATVKGLKNARA